jgi:hypothetical protein
VKTLLKVILACALIWPLSCTVSAQTPAAPCSPSGRSFSPSQVTSVSGCPLSADIEIERSQTLADGTHVQTNTKAYSYRDSQGRIRYESYPPANIGKDVPEAPTMIVIYDPVAGFGYTLLPQTANAYRSKLPEKATRPGVAEQPQRAAFSASPPAQDVDPKTVVEHLGTQRMEGLLAVGMRTTTTIPAGAEGNDRVLTVVWEIWTAKDMGVTLLEKRSDPRTGERETRLTNVEQSEPDAALFQVPAEYAINDK